MIHNSLYKIINIYTCTIETVDEDLSCFWHVNWCFDVCHVQSLEQCIQEREAQLMYLKNTMSCAQAGQVPHLTNTKRYVSYAAAAVEKFCIRTFGGHL